MFSVGDQTQYWGINTSLKSDIIFLHPVQARAVEDSILKASEETLVDLDIIRIASDFSHENFAHLVCGVGNTITLLKAYVVDHVPGVLE